MPLYCRDALKCSRATDMIPSIPVLPSQSDQSQQVEALCPWDFARTRNQALSPILTGSNATLNTLCETNNLVSTMSPCLQSPCPLVCGPSSSIIYGVLSQCERLLISRMLTLRSFLFFCISNETTFIHFSFIPYARVIFLTFLIIFFASMYTLGPFYQHF